MKYRDFYDDIRRRLKEVADNSGIGFKYPAQSIEKFTLMGLRHLMSSIPVAFCDDKGRLPSLPDAPVPGGTDDDLPCPPEMEPALEAYVMRALLESDASDIRDSSFASYWAKRFAELAGV